MEAETWQEMGELQEALADARAEVLDRDRVVDELRSREGRWAAFTEPEIGTIAMGITLVAVDALYDIMGTGEIDDQRKAEILLMVGELVDSMGPRIGLTAGEGIDPDLLTNLRAKVEELQGS